MLPVAIEQQIRADDLLWEKRPEESPKAFSAFMSYRNLEPWQRSLKRAVITQFGHWTNTKQRQFQLWSAKFSWVVRASAWDEEKARTGDAKVLKEIEEMRTRHLQIAKAMQQKAIERLRSLDANELSLTDLVAFLKTGTGLERVTLGQAPEEAEGTTVMNQVIMDFTSITTEQLVQIIARKQIGE